MKSGKCGRGREGGDWVGEGVVCINVRAGNGYGRRREIVPDDGVVRDGGLDGAQKTCGVRGRTVKSVVDELCQSELWSPWDVAYGVIIAQDDIKGDEWPEHAPRELRCAVSEEKPWRREMTVEELFAGVALKMKKNERFFLVYTKLDLRTVHSGETPESEVARDNVSKAVWWLRSLYLNTEGKLRRLKRLGEN